MTVNTTDITSGPYSGNGVTTQFSYDFRVDDKSQLIVYETTDLGAVNTLTVDVDYTVNGIGTDGGGTIDRIAGALPTNYSWYIRADYKHTQNIDLASQGGFFPDVHETALDKLTFLSQQQSDLINRSMRFPDSYSGGADAELPNPEAGKTILWSNDGLSIVNGPTVGTFAGYAAAAESAADAALISQNAAAADLVLTNADVVTTNADAATTTQDAIDTAADVVTTNADAVTTTQDAIDTAADVVTTNADAVTTTQDAIDTAADVVSAGNSADAAAASAATIPAYDTITGQALNFVRLNAGETAMEFRTPAELLADISGLSGGTTGNLSVGFTSDIEVLASDTIAANMALESLKTRSVVGNVTFNVPTGGNSTCHILLSIDASDRAITTHADVDVAGDLPTLTAGGTFLATLIRFSATSVVLQVQEVTV